MIYTNERTQNGGWPLHEDQPGDQRVGVLGQVMSVQLSDLGEEWGAGV